MTTRMTTRVWRLNRPGIFQPHQLNSDLSWEEASGVVLPERVMISQAQLEALLRVLFIVTHTNISLFPPLCGSFTWMAKLVCARRQRERMSMQRRVHKHTASSLIFEL